MTYLYVMGPDNGPYKVGIADDVYRRQTSVQTGSPVDIIIHSLAKAVDRYSAENIEQLIHAELRPYLARGEWFNANINIINNAFNNAGLIFGEPRRMRIPRRAPRAPPKKSRCECSGPIHNIIEEFGGVAKFGRAIGVTTSAASMMKMRCWIEITHWPRIIASSKSRSIGLDADGLMRACLKGRK